MNDIHQYDFAMVWSGAQFGTAATMILSGYLIHGNIFGGWPAVFYVIGGLTIAWFFLWMFFVFDSPADHPRISKDELHFIEKSIGSQSSGKVNETFIFVTIRKTNTFALLPLNVYLCNRLRFLRPGKQYSLQCLSGQLWWGTLLNTCFSTLFINEWVFKFFCCDFQAHWSRLGIVYESLII